MNGKMTARQLTALCAAGMISPATQALPLWAARAGRSGWLMLIICLPLNLLAAHLLVIYKSKPGLGPLDLCVSVFGRVLGKCLLFIVGVAVPMTMLAFNTRMFAARFTATIFPRASETVFMAALLTLTFFITREGPGRAARMGVILLWTALVVLTLLFICSAGSLKAENLLPISPRDYGPLAAVSAAGLSMFGVFALGALLRVSDSSRLTRETRRSMCLTTVFLTAVIMLCAGVLGTDMIKRSDYPVFSAVKALSVPGVLERLDAFAVTFWMLSDNRVQGAGRTVRGAAVAALNLKDA
ncbi:MAG: spore germination protein, partial [Oscillospiraceae bacterium]|nr:spore germination protein [Oscillospiraceae bacterium]